MGYPPLLLQWELPQRLPIYTWITRIKPTCVRIQVTGASLSQIDGISVGGIPILILRNERTKVLCSDGTAPSLERGHTQSGILPIERSRF